mmetsp:Transcript_1591/g.4368  ORF Transcript_1591/g.4368 Transcript_1591/m.4368 type:complete len:214 (+) Transcript_1591:189-830(+)
MACCPPATCFAAAPFARGWRTPCRPLGTSRRWPRSARAAAPGRSARALAPGVDPAATSTPQGATRVACTAARPPWSPARSAARGSAFPAVPSPQMTRTATTRRAVRPWRGGCRAAAAGGASTAPNWCASSAPPSARGKPCATCVSSRTRATAAATGAPSAACLAAMVTRTTTTAAAAVTTATCRWSDCRSLRSPKRGARRCMALGAPRTTPAP